MNHIFDNGDLDEGQDNHDNMDPALHDHIMKAIRHNGGVGPHPGVFKSKGAPVTVPGNWSTPQSEYEHSQKASKDALINIAAGNPPRIPAPPSARPTPMPSVPSV